MDAIEIHRSKIVGVVTNGAEKVAGGAVAVGHHVGSVFTDFRAFLNRGNVVDLAVGLVMGVAFTAIVTSLVKDLITPFIGLALGGRDLDNLFVVLKCPTIAGTTADIPGCRTFPTTLLAEAAGVVTWNYGAFIQVLLNFILISLIIFFLVKTYSAAFRREKPVLKTKKCEFCCSDIPLKATRCPLCTSHVTKTFSDPVTQ